MCWYFNVLTSKITKLDYAYHDYTMPMMDKVWVFYCQLIEKDQHINANMSMMSKYVGTLLEYKVRELEDENQQMQDEVGEEGLHIMEEYANEERDWKQVKHHIECDRAYSQLDENKMVTCIKNI